LIKAPGLGLLVEGANRVVNDGAVGSLDVLGAGFEDRLPVGFIYWDVAFFKTPEADVPGCRVHFKVSEKTRERGKGLVKKINLGGVARVKVGEGRGKRVGAVGDAYAVVEVN